MVDSWLQLRGQPSDKATHAASSSAQKAARSKSKEVDVCTGSTLQRIGKSVAMDDTQFSDLCEKVLFTWCDAGDAGEEEEARSYCEFLGPHLCGGISCWDSKSVRPCALLIATEGRQLFSIFNRSDR